MNNINQTLNQLAVDLMVNCMLNPENELYVGRMSSNSAEYFCKLMCGEDKCATEIFWQAYHIAKDIILTEENIYNIGA